LKTLTIIDTFGFFFRSYYALPPLRNSQGFPTGLLTGFLNLVDSLHRDHATDYLLFALDSAGETFRHGLDTSYKSNRAEVPEDLKRQLPVAIEWIEQMGFANLSREGFEADDVIATVSRFAKEAGLKVRIVSHDKDLYQLIEDGRVEIYDAIKKEVVDEARCVEKFGVFPKDFINFQAIVGDSADNVAGVKGIGKVGATKLINQYHTLEAIYEDIENAGTARTQKLLLQSKESAFVSRELVRLREDTFADIDLERFVFEDKNYLGCLVEELEQYEMKQALKKARADEEQEPKEEPKHFEAITLDTKAKLDAVLEGLEAMTIVAFDTETTGLDTKCDRLVGFSFCMEEERAYYVPIAHHYLGVGEQVALGDALEAIGRILKCQVVGQNLKFDFALLEQGYGIMTPLPHGDTMILAWLYNPAKKVGLDALAELYLDYTMKSFKEVVKKGEDFSSVAIDDASFYAGEDAWITWRLYHLFSELIEPSLLEIATQIEYPFIAVLRDMERAGVRVDSAKLVQLEEHLSGKIASLSEAIYDDAQEEFNIKSTRQLGHILFGKLQLKGGKKTKTGYSTNEAVLKGLIDDHPIIAKILEFREVQKILSTYVKPLLKLSKKDKESRIYTSFLQTGTATGRLSSSNPNLQNIPVRSPLGRLVREAFVAKEGYKLVSIDYSQIELRLLAHFSQDEALLEAFRSGEDIHLATSMRLFGKEEANAKRSFAKSINFGLLYGMGATKLSNELSITTKEAKAIITEYFEAFPTVKSYLESIQEGMKERGFVQTLLGRRRLFDYEGANGMQKASFLRESINTVFQGSASDLMKLSMNAIATKIQDESLDASMLLQIHDELIFEINANQAESLGAVFATMMEQIVPLQVPLVCSMEIGDSWGELK
jgi:DNA polymerase-1